MKYTESTPSYNDRRYGKPWQAKLTDAISQNFEFLDWDGRPGGAGVFRFEAEPGTLLAYGQKDIRKGRGGVDGYMICMPDGSCQPVSDKTALKLIGMEIGERVVECARMKVEHFKTLAVKLEAELAVMREYDICRPSTEKDLVMSTKRVAYYEKFCVGFEKGVANA